MLKRVVLIAILMLTLTLGVMVSADDNLDPMTVSFAAACGHITAENPEPGAFCREVMALRPAPQYAQVQLDSATVNDYSFWKVTGENPALYSAPDDAIVGTMNSGFNYVRALSQSPGWVQIEGGEWMSEADLTFAQPSIHRGLVINDGLSEHVAWVLGNVFTSPRPGADPAQETGKRYWRYNLVNIFAQVEVDGWRWYMVGPDQWIEQRMVAKAMRTARPENVSGNWIAVDLYEQTLIAYQDDEPVFATVIASGLSGWETNEGIFEVWYRVPSGSMSGSFGAPDAYDLQSVPWTLYFDGDISLHGTYWHDGFGYRRSHGCVNLSISDSRWLYEWTQQAQTPVNEDGQLVNYVYVHSSGEYQ